MSLLDERFKRRDDVLHQDVSGSLMLFSMAAGQYFTLGDVGARVWELCDGVRSVADVVGVVCGEYAAPPSEIEHDVIALIRDLADERLVVKVDGEKS